MMESRSAARRVARKVVQKVARKNVHAMSRCLQKAAGLSYETVMDLLGIMEPEERRRCLSLLSQESLQGQEK